MFWAILSGIEGNLPAYNAVLKDIKRQKVPVDELYILGDLIGPRPDSEALVKQMQQDTQLRAQICTGWWEEQLFNLYGWGSDPDATQLKARYGAAGVKQLWNAVSRDTVQRLRSLDFGFFELDCLLIHGSTVGCDDTLTPETSPITMLDRLLRSDANTLFCGRSGLAFQYQLPTAQVTSTVQSLAVAQGSMATGNLATAPPLPKQHILNARQVVGVGNVGRIFGHASYTLYNPYANIVQFKQVTYSEPSSVSSSSRGKGFSCD